MSGQSIEVPYLSRSDVSKMAYLVRRELKITEDIFPIIPFLELVMPMIFADFHFGVLSKEEMGFNHGLTVPSENAIYLRQDVYEGALRGNARDRFTAAHELGHYLMHLDVPVTYHRTIGRKRLPPEIDSESQANLFAAAILMPEKKLRKCRTLNEAAAKFGVSRRAVGFLNRILVREKKMKVLS